MDMMIDKKNKTQEEKIENFGDKAFWHQDYSSINYRKYVVVGVELTGQDLHKDSLLSIGAIKMKGSRIELGKTFYKSLKPKGMSKLRNLISNEGIQPESDEKTNFEEILKEFGDFCGKDIIAGHSIFVGMNFIDKAAGKMISPVIFNPMLDISLVYEYLKENHPALKRFISYAGDPDLYKLARRFGISSNGVRDALKEAFIAAQLFQRFIHMLVDIGITKMDDLQKIGNPTAQESRYMVSGKIINF